MTGKSEAEVMASLEQWVMHDGKPITARLLSIRERVHISVAHRYMGHFHEEASGKGSEYIPFTTWIIKGSLKETQPNSQLSSDSMDVDDDNDDGPKAGPARRQSLLLVAQDKVQEAEVKFEKIDVKEIYSFSPRLPNSPLAAHKVAAISQVTTIQHDFHSIREYVDTWESTSTGVELGTIRDVSAWKDGGKRALPEVRAGPFIKTGVTKKEERAPIKAELPAEEAKKAVKKSPAGEKSKGLDWSKAKGVQSSKPKRKLVESDDEQEEGGDAVMASAEDGEEEAEDAGPIGYKDGALKAEAGTGGEQVGATRKRADAGDKVSRQEEARQRRKKELMDMMDEDDDGQAVPPAIEASESVSTSMMQGSADKGEGQGRGDQVGAKRRVKKQRKVTRKETTKDAKGYRKTVDVDAYESYSSDESDAPPPPAAAPPPKARAEPKGETAKAIDNSTSSSNAAGKKGQGQAGAGGGAGGNQRKLSSFFAKGRRE